MSVVAASVSPVFPVRVDNAENTEWNINELNTQQQQNKKTQCSWSHN